MSRLIDEFLKNGAGELNFLGKTIFSLVLLCFAFILIKLVNRTVKRILRSKLGVQSLEGKKTKTVVSLIRSVTVCVIFFSWLISAMKIFGINTAGLLTTAGIGGVAVGFASKSLVEDIISGAFLMAENRYSIGDYVVLASKEGLVENISLRTTTIRDYSGELHTIPNGEIRIVTNRSKNIQRALVTFTIAYKSDYERAVELLNTALADRLKDVRGIIEAPSVWGITSLNDSSVTLTASCKTIPGEQWNAERIMRFTGLKALEDNGIEVPFNKLDVKLVGDRDA